LKYLLQQQTERADHFVEDWGGNGFQSKLGLKKEEGRGGGGLHFGFLKPGSGMLGDEKDLGLRLKGRGEWREKRNFQKRSLSLWFVRYQGADNKPSNKSWCKKEGWDREERAGNVVWGGKFLSRGAFFHEVCGGLGKHNEGNAGYHASRAEKRELGETE